MRSVHTLGRHQQWCRREVQIPCSETSDGIFIVSVNDKRRRAGTNECFFQQKNVTEGKPLCNCNLCSFSSKQKQVMKSHLKVHSELKPAFRCPIQGCKFLAKWPQTVREHSRLTHQEKLHLRNPGTNLSSYHKSTHLNEELIKCPNLGCNYMTCSFLFQNLISHQRWCREPIPCAETSDGIRIVALVGDHDKMRSERIIGETLYSCEICSFTSERKQCLIDHLEIHSKFSPAFRCPFQGCMFLAKWPQTVRNHSELVHQIELTPKMPFQRKDNLGPATDCGTESEVEVNESSSMAFACMLCDFVGDNELSALEHARQHTAVPIPSNGSTLGVPHG